MNVLEFGNTLGIRMRRCARRFHISSDELTQIKRNRGYLPMEQADSEFAVSDLRSRSLSIQGLGREIQRWTGLTLDLSQPVHVEVSHASRVMDTAHGNTNLSSLRPDRKEYLIQRLNDPTVLYFLSTD